MTPLQASAASQQGAKGVWSYLLLGNLTPFDTRWFLDTLEQPNVWRYHEWSGTSRDTDRCPGWHPGGGRGGSALLLYLQTGWFAPFRWTWQVLRDADWLSMSPCIWGVVKLTDFWHVISVKCWISARLVLSYARFGSDLLYLIIEPDGAWHDFPAWADFGVVDWMIFCQLLGILLQSVGKDKV